MIILEVVYAKFSGPTASFRIPSIISGDQLSLAVPSYSNILGMLSYAANREIKPSETRIGFRYEFSGRALDLETFYRWKRNENGTYSYHDKGSSIRRREFHYDVTLEIILTNLKLYDIIDRPYRQLSLGRSQDLLTVEKVEIIEIEPVNEGELFGTLLPLDNNDISINGYIYKLPEYFKYIKGKVRRPQSFRTFIALDSYIQNISFPNLYNIKKLEYPTFYLHQWYES